MARILVVEDDARLVAFLRRALTAAGFAVDAALTGDSALVMLQAGEYDLVALDLALPGKDGVAVLSEALEARPDQRVIVISALADVSTKIRCLDLGAQDYLVKPVAIEELVARVRARLRTQGGGESDTTTLRAGKLELNMRRHTATGPDGVAPLSTREIALLEHLMRHAGEVCSRDELLRAVWGYSFDPGTNVVDVYVRRLRGKLGARTIETVRNVGYAFVAA